MSPSTRTVTPREHQRRELEEILDAGDPQEAFRRSRAIGPLDCWRGVEGRLLAARIARHVGAPRRARAYGERARREHPTDARAFLEAARMDLGERHPMWIWWQLERRVRGFRNVEAEERAGLLALRGALCSRLRDFERAADFLDLAITSGGGAWPALERVVMLERADRLDDAWAAAENLEAERGWERPVQQIRAHLLDVLDRPEEAVDALVALEARDTSSLVSGQLLGLYAGLERWEEARAAAERTRRRAPLMEADREYRRFVLASEARLAEACGDFSASLRLAREADVPEFTKQMEESESRRGGRRIVLDVPWVRQDRLTCAPATLTSLCRYWGVEADHLEIVERICWDGTPAHSQRRWAEEQGLGVRELTVDWDVARALLDRGVPFALVTVGAGAAHLQPIVGYDERHRTLLSRDPGRRGLSEIDVDALIGLMRSTGPRGLVLLPRGEEERLDGLELPESELYDGSYRLDCALEALDRERAEEAAAELRRLAPDHRLELLAQRALAAWDDDHERQERVLGRLASRYPEDANLVLGHLQLVGEMKGIRLRAGELERRSAEDPTGYFAMALARDWAERLQRPDEAERLLWGVLRRRPEDPEPYRVLGGIRWRRGQHSEALELQRVAACLGDFDEGLHGGWLQSARALGREAEAVDALESRARRLGGRKAAPWITLAISYEVLGRAAEAERALERGLRVRPDDEDLLLFAAESAARHGRRDDAQNLLERARGRAREGRWLRAAAGLDEREGRVESALSRWREVLAADPRNVEALHEASRLRGLLEGPDAERAELAAAVERYPSLVGPRAALIAHLRAEQDYAGVERVVRERLEQEGGDAWARRELAVTLAETGRLEEAWAELEEAGRSAPDHPSYPNIRATLTLLEHDGDRVVAELENALELDPDNCWALLRLLEVEGDPQTRRDLVERWAARIGSTSDGPGIEVVARAVRRSFDAESALATLRSLAALRPELLEPRLALAQHLETIGRLDEARREAEALASRFPSRTEPLWRRASVEAIAKDPSAERRHLQRILELDPADSEARVRLLDLALADENVAQARALAEDALRRDVADPGALLGRARVALAEGRADEAVADLERAAELRPDDAASWNLLAEHGGDGGPARARALAERLTSQRPGDPMVWLRLAESEPEPAAALRVLESGLERSPRDVSLLLMRVRVLRALERFDEALAACRPTVLGERRPIELVGEEATMLAERRDPELALQTIRGAVERDPNYVYGWYKRAEWAEQAGHLDEAAEAAERLVALVPHDGEARVVEARIRLAREDVEGARSSLLAALEREPELDEAEVLLAEVEARSGTGAEGQVRLESLWEARGTDWIAVRGLEIALQLDHRAIAKWMQRVVALEDPKAVGYSFQRVLSLAPTRVRTWEALARRESAGPWGLVPAVLRVGEEEGIGDAWKWLMADPVETRAWGMAAGELMVAEWQQDGPKRLPARLQRFGATLRRVRESRDQGGRILLAAGRPELAVKWLEGVEEEDGVESGVLRDAWEAWRCMGRDDRAELVARRVAAKAEAADDPELAPVLLWLSVREAARGDVARARRLARQWSESDFPLESPSETLMRLVAAIDAVAAARGSSEAFREARRDLAGVRGRDGGSAPRRRTRLAAQRAVARLVGGWKAWLWARML